MPKKRAECPDCGHRFTIEIGGKQVQRIGVRARRATVAVLGTRVPAQTLFIKIIAEDIYHPDIWHNDKVGQTFEVIQMWEDLIPPRHEVRYAHPGGTSKTAYVSFNCAELIPPYPVCHSCST